MECKKAMKSYDPEKRNTHKSGVKEINGRMSIRTKREWHSLEFGRKYRKPPNPADRPSAVDEIRPGEYREGSRVVWIALRANSVGAWLGL
jgi:hypothetical protein